MKFQVEATQRLPRIETFRILEASVTGSATANSTVMPEGFTRGTILEAANNNYTLAFNEPFARIPVVQITCLNSTATLTAIATIVSVTAAQVVFHVEGDDGVALATTGFHVTVMGYDTADQL